jgi:hypothetical protein
MDELLRVLTRQQKLIRVAASLLMLACLMIMVQQFEISHLWHQEALQHQFNQSQLQFDQEVTNKLTKQGAK